jgi:hypothetical protein
VKSKRRSFPRSAQTIRRRVLGNDDRTLVESKCPACDQIVSTIVGTVMDESPERSENAASVPDLKKLLHFPQQLYAHALTLQEMIRTEGKVTYEADPDTTDWPHSNSKSSIKPLSGPRGFANVVWVSGGIVV